MIYIAHIDGKETEEMTFEDLKFLALSRNLPSETPVRLSEEQEWRTWGEIPALQLQRGAARAHYARPMVDAPNITLSRDVLRSETAYPFLRMFGSVMIGVSVVVALIGWIAAFSLGGIVMYVAAIIATVAIPCSIFSNGVAQVLIDIADISLKKKVQ